MPGYRKQIVCLANSLKNGGRCIAGKEFAAAGYGDWIRPVSDRETQELSLVESRYRDGSWPKLLEIVDLSLAKPVPRLHQVENHQIAIGGYWAKRGEVSFADLPKLVDSDGELWSNGMRTQFGENDCVSRTEAAKFTHSLLLIGPQDAIVRVAQEGPIEYPRKIRVRFLYRGVRYSLKLTDPVAEKIYHAKGDGEYPLSGVYLCVSLTEPFGTHGRCYKIVAAIFSQQWIK